MRARRWQNNWFTASSASLLLNLEGVFSILIAWFVFRENFDRRIALGVLAITAGALLLRFNGGFVWTNAVSIAPFVGALIAVVFLGDPLTMRLIFSAVLMSVGLWLHLSERHEHVHTHTPLLHNHRHVHDSHHRHVHDVAQTGAEPHAHMHRHAPLRHAHPHYPDEHHRHEH